MPPESIRNPPRANALASPPGSESRSAETESGATLAAAIARAARRHRAHIFTKNLAPSLAVALILALAGMFWFERTRPKLEWKTRCAIAFTAAAAGVAAAVLPLRRRGNFVNVLEEKLHCGSLISTAQSVARDLENNKNASGNIIHDHAGSPARVNQLCLRSANAQLKSAHFDKLFPLVAPRLGFAAVLFCCILASAFLPRIGLWGIDRDGIGISSADSDLARADRDGANVNKDKVNNNKTNNSNNTNTEKTNNNENANNSAAAPPPVAPPPAENSAASSEKQQKPDSQPAPEKSPESKPQTPKETPGENNKKDEAAPSEPPPVDPFTATPKVVPIDPAAGPRANRTTLVLDQKEGYKSSGPTAPPARREVTLDDATVGDMERAAESGLARRTLRPAENLFIKKYFECLRTKK